jgi:hypothetical protein
MRLRGQRTVGADPAVLGSATQPGIAIAGRRRPDLMHQPSVDAAMERSSMVMAALGVDANASTCCQSLGQLQYGTSRALRNLAQCCSRRVRSAGVLGSDWPPDFD